VIMSYIRIWKDLDVQEVKKHLLVWGMLNGDCGNCKYVGLPLEAKVCPSCKTEFKYLALRNKSTPSYVEKIIKKRPDLLVIDWQDFSFQYSRKEAKKFLE